MAEEYVAEFPIPSGCSSVLLFQNRESLIKYADIWGVVPIIGDGSLDDDENFPGVYMAFKTSGKTMEAS